MHGLEGWGSPYGAGGRPRPRPRPCSVGSFGRSFPLSRVLVLAVLALRALGSVGSLLSPSFSSASARPPLILPASFQSAGSLKAARPIGLAAYARERALYARVTLA
jgi:hypothetical protein